MAHASYELDLVQRGEIRAGCGAGICVGDEGTDSNVARRDHRLHDGNTGGGERIGHHGWNAYSRERR